MARISVANRDYTIRDSFTKGLIATFSVTMTYVTDGTTIVGENISVYNVRPTHGVNFQILDRYIERAANRSYILGCVRYSFRNSQGVTINITDKTFRVNA